MYLEVSLAIANCDLEVCSLEENGNPFEDTFAVEPEPVVTISPESSDAATVSMSRSVNIRQGKGRL